ncbi:ACT domain-containing protein [Nocardioides sp. CPCC 205120]|uniref:ACT domain-containing protein n=1 Tax=Nocardioides sp. CPCC 205120 TaxID=3406462 RepID=UPI003B50CABD
MSGPDETTPGNAQDQEIDVTQDDAGQDQGQEQGQDAAQAGDQGQEQAVPGPFTLHRFPEKLAVVAFGPGSEVPAWAESSSVFAVIATAVGTTVVCAARDVPTKARAQRPMTAFEVAGPLDVEQPGLHVELLSPLAEAGWSARVLSTYDAEWVLVPTKHADKAETAWRRRGHTVSAAVPATPASGR